MNELVNTLSETELKLRVGIGLRIDIGLRKMRFEQGAKTLFMDKEGISGDYTVGQDEAFHFMIPYEGDVFMDLRRLSEKNAEIVYGLVKDLVKEGYIGYVK